MQHAWIGMFDGFPPEIKVEGGPLAGRYSTLTDLSRAALAVPPSKEGHRLWGIGLDEAFFMALREGIRPQMEFRPLAGVTRVHIAPRVQLADASPHLPADVFEAHQGADAAEMFGVLREAREAIERGLHVSADAGIGAATSAAAFGPWRLRYQVWGPEMYGPDDVETCRAAYHAGLAHVWHAGAVRAPGVEISNDPIWADESPAVMPEGWRLLEYDRSSAYADDASGRLPDVCGPVVRDPAYLMDCAGGAIIRARVDLSGFRGVGFPIRVRIGVGMTRQVAARAGTWEGHWTSEILRWAAGRGARVEVLGGIGWVRGARFLGPIMDRLYTLKEQAQKGSVPRAIYRAAIQRAVGRLGRAPVDTVTLCGPDADAEIANPASWPVKWRKIHGAAHGYFVADPLEAPTTPPRYSIPPWPAFVVSRAWIRLHDRIEALAARGAWPMYCDTDGVLVACPPDAVMPDEHGMGGFRVKAEWLASEHRQHRQWIRVDQGGALKTQYAGVERHLQRAAFEGTPIVRTRSSAIVELSQAMRAIPDRIGPVLRATADGVRKRKVYGRSAEEF